MIDNELDCIIEAILFAAGDPVPLKRLQSVLEIDYDEINGALTRLSDFYSFSRRGIALVRLEESVQLCSRSEYGDYVRKMLETRRAPTLTPTALEVLSIIAYRQPVTRLQIETIRGADSSYTVASLAEKGLIEECGRLDVPGRPHLYRTTYNFLRSFGLESIDDLPDLDAEIGEQLAVFDIDSENTDNSDVIALDSITRDELFDNEEQK